MKLSRLLSIAALCIASTSLSGNPLVVVAAEDASLSNEGSLISEAVLEAAEPMAEAKDADCLEKGFDVETLDCRVCNMLALTLSLQQETEKDKAVAQERQRATEEAVAKCQRCCTDVEAIDALAQKHQYARAVLEVCTCKFGRLPKIANFVNQHASQHKRLEIQYMNARMPHLIFYDDDGGKKEEVSIASWDEETISEFIGAKLKKIEEVQTETIPVDDETSESTGVAEEMGSLMEENDEADREAEEVVEVVVSADAD